MGMRGTGEPLDVFYSPTVRTAIVCGWGRSLLKGPRPYGRQHSPFRGFLGRYVVFHDDPKWLESPTTPASHHVSHVRGRCALGSNPSSVVAEFGDRASRMWGAGLRIVILAQAHTLRRYNDIAKHYPTPLRSA